MFLPVFFYDALLKTIRSSALFRSLFQFDNNGNSGKCNSNEIPIFIPYKKGKGKT